MPYQIDKPPERIKDLPTHAQHIWVRAFNSSWKQYNKDEEKANSVAWGAVKRSYKQDPKTKKWSKMAGETTASSLDPEGETMDKSFAGKSKKKKEKYPKKNTEGDNMEETKSGINARGVRDGTGPFKGSYQRSVSDKGKRQIAGEKCPVTKKKMSKFEKWTTAYKNSLPDSAFAIVMKEGDKTIRKLPYKDKEGKVDVPHLRNALVRVAQDKTTLNPSQRNVAINKLKAIAKKYLNTNKETKSGSVMSKFISKFEEGKITQIKNALKDIAAGKKPNEFIEISVKQISLLIQDLEAIEEQPETEDEKPAGEEKNTEEVEKEVKEEKKEPETKKEAKDSKKVKEEEEPKEDVKKESSEKESSEEVKEDAKKEDTEEESKFQELLEVCDGYKKELGNKDDIISKMGKDVEKLTSENANLTKEISKFKEENHKKLISLTTEKISKFKNLAPHEKIRLEHEYSKMSDSALEEIGRITETEMFSKLEEPKPTTQPSEMLRPSKEEEKPFSKMSKEEQLDAIASSNASDNGFIE